MNVLIVFYSRGGESERLALTTGVGAIQAYANIRLRRLTPDADVDSGPMTSSQHEAFARMARDYTAPRPADAEWADAFILALSENGRRHMDAYLQGLSAIGPMGGKIAAPVTAGGSEVVRPIYAAAAAAGLIVVPMPAEPLDSIEVRHAFGRHVVALATAIKSTRLT